MFYSKDIKRKAVSLRGKGFSIIQIARDLGLAKSTVSLWVRDIALPQRILKLLQGKEITGRKKGLAILKAKRDLNKLEHAREATNLLINNMHLLSRKDILQLFCAIIFWCEGSKRRISDVRFTNSDPALVRFFLYCLRTGFDAYEHKFRAMIHLHEYHDHKQQTFFWSKVTGIALSQFLKPYVKPHTGKRERPNYEGCLSIRYHDAEIAKRLDALYHALAQWIAGGA